MVPLVKRVAGGARQITNMDLLPIFIEQHDEIPGLRLKCKNIVDQLSLGVGCNRGDFIRCDTGGRMASQAQTIHGMLALVHHRQRLRPHQALVWAVVGGMTDTALTRLDRGLVELIE